jgi:hypothetical protein
MTANKMNPNHHRRRHIDVSAAKFNALSLLVDKHGQNSANHYVH